MVGVALGIRSVQSQLPDLVYALLSGLNASTVGLIAVAAVQLSERAINNQMTRFIICTTGSVGILYQGKSGIFTFSTEIALWYYPVLMVISGIAMVIYDSRIVHKYLNRLRDKFRRRQETQVELGDIGNSEEHPVAGPEPEPIRVDTDNTQKLASGTKAPQSRQVVEEPQNDAGVRSTQPIPGQDDVKVPYGILVGLFVLIFFLVSFVIIMVLRGVLPSLPSDFLFFANLYLAGIFLPPINAY